jgi:hypothetical protein
MNVRYDAGTVHHLVDETQRALCGYGPQGTGSPEGSATARVTCPACTRLLADDVRRTVAHGVESED